MILGMHYLIDIYDCKVDKLKSVNQIKNIMVATAKIGKLKVVSKNFHQFRPYGVSGVLVLKESHFSIHTWPEYNYASIDLYLCDLSINIDKIISFLKIQFNSTNIIIQKIERGNIKTDNLIYS